jgi:hypothetical protein
VGWGLPTHLTTVEQRLIRPARESQKAGTHPKLDLATECRFPEIFQYPSLAAS